MFGFVFISQFLFCSNWSKDHNVSPYEIPVRGCTPMRKPEQHLRCHSGEQDAQPGYSKFKQSARQLTDELPLIPMRCPRLCVRHSLISNTCTAYVQLQQTLKVELLAQNVPAPLCFTIQSPNPKAKHCLLKTLPPLAHLRCTGSARVAITTFPAYPHDLAIHLDGRCN